MVSSWTETYSNLSESNDYRDPYQFFGQKQIIQRILYNVLIVIKMYDNVNDLYVVNRFLWIN